MHGHKCTFPNFKKNSQWYECAVYDRTIRLWSNIIYISVWYQSIGKRSSIHLIHKSLSKSAYNIKYTTKDNNKRSPLVYCRNSSRQPNCSLCVPRGGWTEHWNKSRDITKPTNWVCAQRRLRSAWASAQSEQSLRCPHEESLGPALHIERTAKTLIRPDGCPGWSESSLGAQPHCLFCHVAAHKYCFNFCVNPLDASLGVKQS